MQAYEKALKEENYSWAAKLRDAGGLGLIGWWWATSSSHDGIQPHLLRVSPGPNRLMFHAFTPIEFGMKNVSILYLSGSVSLLQSLCADSDLPTADAPLQMQKKYLEY